MYDLYWWASDIYGDSFDHRGEAGNLRKFLNGLPLSNGNYADAVATGTAGLRIVGQKDLTNNKAHLWIQNAAHTWRNVVDGAAITPITGSVELTMAPDTEYTVTAWDTYSGSPTDAASIASNGSGVLTIPITSLSTDIAFQVDHKGRAGRRRSPSPGR